MDYLEAWKIPTRLFYPVGIYNFGDQCKTVIIIWSLNKLIILAFRGIEDAIKQNKSPYSVSEIISNGEVLDIISTKTNTICLSDQGCTYFTSYKTIAKISTMKHITKIKSYNKGFICIMNNSSNVSIQLYNDDFIHVKTYNLDWDAIPTQSKRISEIYALNVIEVNNNNNNFLRTFLKVENEDLGSLNEIIIFSIYSTLYWLQVEHDSDDYNVVTLHTSVTNILSIFYSKNQKIVILLLQCGLLEIFHQTGHMIKISQIFLENEIIYSSFLEQKYNNIFIYTNKFGLFQSNIIYDNKLNEYKIQTKMQPIFGVTCFTYINGIKLIICATENNCFYSTKLLFEEEINDIDIMEKNNKFICIDNEFLKQNRNFEECLVNEIKTFNEIKKEEKMIQASWKQLGIISNERFINNFNENYCIITAMKSMQLLNAQSFVPKFKYQPETVFLKIQLFIKTNLLAIVEFDKMWKICITLNDIQDKNICYSLELASYDLTLPVDFLIPYNPLNKHFTLPKIEVLLIAIVNLSNESILIKIPIYLRNEDCYYTSLIEFVDKPLQCFTNSKISLIDKMLLHLSQNNIKTKNNVYPVKKEINFNFILPTNCNETHLIKIFPKANNFEMNKELFLTFNQSNVKLFIDSKTSMLTLSSDNPGALYYIKQHIIASLLKMFTHYQLSGHILGKLQVLLTSLNDHLDFENVKFQILLDLLSEVRQLCAVIFFLEK